MTEQQTTIIVAPYPKRVYLNHCKTCGRRFNKPEYFTVENQWGYLQRISYCPHCASQNIDTEEFTD